MRLILCNAQNCATFKQVYMFGLGKKTEKNNANINQTYVNAFNWFDWFRGWFWDGKTKTALRTNMFYACVRLLSNSVATTPINIINKNNQEIDSNLNYLLKNQPNSYQAAFDFWLQVMFDLLVFGNAYVLKNKAGDKIASLQVLRPDFMQVEWAKKGGKLYKYTTQSGLKEFIQDSIIHYKMLSLDGLIGLKPIDLLLDSFRVSGKLNKFLETDNFPPVMKTPEELMKDNQVTELAEQVSEKLQQKPFILPQGFELILSNSHSAFDKKFAELKKFTNEEIARFFNIPFGLVGLDGASQPNVLDTQNRILLQYALNPYLRMIEQTTENAIFSRNEIENSGYRVKFNRNAILLQTDANQRADWYKKMTDLAVYDTDRIKQLEDIYA